MTMQESPELLSAIYRHFREYFDMAERKRRWSITEDIPWDNCNKSLPPALADVVETFVAVELYLPDYLSKLIPQVRKNRGRAWMLANWGYEECKHSMALEDWLLKSGQRSEEQITDMHARVFDHEWNLPYDNAMGMLAYTTLQELATRIHYTRLRDEVKRAGGCPALEKALTLIATDEAAHADFFRRLFEIYLRHDRDAAVEQLREVINTFKMPAVHMLADSMKRMHDVQDLKIFTEEMFVKQVYIPVVTKLGVDRRELRRKKFRERVVMQAGTDLKP
ncbi:MAG: acyl-ACP desaturase [Gemmataceae bacterium]|nr:acyl-ACP desaturase [Gemmataceae bacterium]